MKPRFFTLCCCFLLAMGLCSLSNCHKQHDCKSSAPVTRNLEDYDLEKVPYTGYERLTFKNTDGDSLMLLGKGTVIDYGTDITQEECPRTYKLQRKSWVFAGPDNARSLIVSVMPYSHNTSPYVEITFYNTSYYEATVSLSRPFDFDSLQIQKKYYYNIQYFQNMDHNGCYYNLTEGVLKMETRDSDRWELVRIER